jgi:prepilin-type N-terminal cleavage/methylation domain-containing protein
MIIKTLKGYTLIELMIAIAIIGILAVIATPIYSRYTNEAKATELLMLIHRISLSYLDASYDEIPVNSATPAPYDSKKFGQAPSAFAGMDDLYTTKGGIQLASFVVDKMGMFSPIVSQSMPVIYIHASKEQNMEILQALNHIMKMEHVYLSREMLVVSLSNRTPTLHHDSHQVSVITHKLNTPTMPKQTSPNLVPSIPAVATSTQAPPLLPNLVPTITPIATKQPVTGTGNSQTQQSPIITPSQTITSTTHTDVQTILPDPHTGHNQHSTTQGLHTFSGIPANCLRHYGWVKNHLHGC